MEIDKDKIFHEAITLASAIIYRKSFNIGNSNYDFINIDYDNDKEKIEKIIDYAIDEAIRASKIVNEKIKDIVYCGDLVTISVNDTMLERYLIGRVEQAQYVGGHDDICDYKYLYVQKELGRLLVGKSVGDELYYSEGNAKNPQKIKILSTRRTKFSQKLDECELQADLKYKK